MRFFLIRQDMATVFETRLIGNIGKDAHIKSMDRGIIAINFPVAHNKNWKDKKTGQMRTKTTWVNCTIWKRDGSNMRILDFLTRGTPDYQRGHKSLFLRDRYMPA